MFAKRSKSEKLRSTSTQQHYSGFAPATVELFRSLCKVKGIETPLNVQLPAVIEPTLFDISPN